MAQYDCLFCNREFGFINDKAAEDWGCQVIGYSDSVKFVRCFSCVREEANKEDNKKTHKIYHLNPLKSYIAPKTKNELMFEKVI